MFLPYSPAALADILYQMIDSAVAERGRASLAIPGGRSPGPVLQALAERLDAFLRDRLHLLWVDERALPCDHAERNDTATLAAWQAGGPLPAAVHPMPAEAADLDQAAIAYAATLRQATGDGVLDCCLLGIGADGHLASLFPEHPALEAFSEVVVVTDSPKPPPRRLSLSLPVLARARVRMVLCLGADKGAIAARVRDGAPGPQCPVSLLPRAGTAWYLDAAATGMVAD